MSDETLQGFEAMTAESMPMVRKVFKVVGMIAFAFIWIAAMYMTLSAMLFRTEGQAWWVVVGMVALGIGADFWVGAGPVILRSSAKWGIKGWVVVGWITLVIAIGFSFSNKLAYWVGITDRHDAAQIAASVDHLAADRELVAANERVRVPAAVRAEHDATRRAIEAKEAEIASMPEEWPLRLRRAQRELLDLQTREGALAGEYETATAVAAAQARIDAEAEQDAVRQSGARTQSDPMVEWIIGLLAAFGVAATPAQALIWLHAAYSLFHELAQFSFLGLATLRIPLHKMEEEQKFIISQKRLHAEKRVELLRANVEKLTRVRMAQESFRAARSSIKQIAEAEAELETMRKLRDVERRKRAFLMEETPYDIPEGRLVEDMRDAPDPVEEAAKQVIEAVIEAGGSPDAAAAAARAATSTSFKTEAAKDSLTGDFVDYEQITYMRRKPKKKGDKLDRAEAKVKSEQRGPKNTKRFWNKDGTTTEMERGVEVDGGNRIAQTPAGPIDLDNPGVAPSAAEGFVGGAPERIDDNDDASDRQSNHRDAGEEPKAPNDSDASETYANDKGGSLQSSDLIQDVPPAEELTDDLASFLEEPETQVEADQQSEQPREEPETDERRMIAANVAAE